MKYKIICGLATVSLGWFLLPEPEVKVVETPEKVKTKITEKLVTDKPRVLKEPGPDRKLENKAEENAKHKSKDHSEAKKSFQHLSNDEISEQIRAINSYIAEHRLIERANQDDLSEEERRDLDERLVRAESLHLVKIERLLDET